MLSWIITLTVLLSLIVGANDNAKLNYYQLLGVDVKADAVSLKKGYRRAIHRFHPDTNQNLFKEHPELAEKYNQHTKKIIEAYKVLSNEKLRAAYDLTLAPPPVVPKANAVENLTDYLDLHCKKAKGPNLDIKKYQNMNQAPMTGTKFKAKF